MLLDLLIPVYVYYGKDVDLSELERADEVFRDDFRANSPMGMMRQRLSQGLDNFSKGQHQSEQPELQKKEQQALPQKKGKAAQKRAKKKKKKKRK